MAIKRTPTIAGCRKLKLSHQVDRIVVSGWDRNSFSKHTTHRAGKFGFCIRQMTKTLQRTFLSDRAPLQHIDSESVEIGVNAPANRPARSNPMPMPPIALGRGIVPVLIESGSASMCTLFLSFPSPHFTNSIHTLTRKQVASNRVHV